jgi:hypothetical protein
MSAIAPSPNPPVLEEINSGLPNICGSEAEISAATNSNEPVFLPKTNLRLENIQAGFACALHMHQPTIPTTMPEYLLGAIPGWENSFPN